MHRPAQVSRTLLVLLVGILSLAQSGKMVVFAQEQAVPISSVTAEGSLAELDALTLIAMPTRIGDDMSLKIKPGDKKQVTVKVHNQSKAAVTVATKAEDLVVDTDGSTPIPINVPDADNRWSLASWVTIVPNQTTIRPNETAAIAVLIEVPEDALPGGHYAMITHQPTVGGVNVQGAETATGINQNVGTLVYVVVEGPVIEQAFIRDLTVPEQSDFGPVPFSFKIDNESDVHINPSLTFNVYNIWNKRIHSEAVPSNNIFPKASRDFSGEWTRIWGYGRYKAEIVMVYGSASSTVLASSTFWLFPLKLLLAIGVLLITFIGVIVSIRRHMIHRSENQSKRVRELEEKVAQMEQEKTQTPQV